MRWCKVKGTRTSMNVPQWVRDEWQSGDKDSMADLFVRENFNKDPQVTQVVQSHCTLFDLINKTFTICQCLRAATY